MKSYINVYKSSAEFLTHIYIEDGIRKVDKVRYKPFLGIESSKENKWKDIYGKKLGIVEFDSMPECYLWKKSNKDVLKIYGDINFENQFIATTYKDEPIIQKSAMQVVNIDIEVRAEAGFPNPEKADDPIVTIAAHNMVKNTYMLFGFKDLDKPISNCTYIRCLDESDMLMQFINWVENNPIDIFTGWYTEGFDIPYIVNRCKKIFKHNEAARMSIDKKIITTNKADGTVRYSFQGMISWDYKELYEEFTGDPRERYSLDYISKFELGQGKLDYKDDDNRSLTELYDNDFQTFCEYNIKDTELVYLIDQKIKYIDLAISYMYMMKCCPDEIFGTIKPWDSFLYHELYHKNILASPIKNSIKQEFVGGYCANPVVGMHKWVTVYDIASSYPNQIRSFNMSPETIIEDRYLPNELLKVRNEFGSIEKCIDVEKLESIKDTLEHYDVTFTSTGQFFRRDKQGFIPEVVGREFKNRQAIKRKISENKKLITTNPPNKAKLLTENIVLDLQQYTKKIALNSLYGGLANIYFRYFDVRIAEAITSNGQVCVRGATNFVEKYVANVKNIANDTDSMFLTLDKVVNERFNGNVPTDNKRVADFILKYQEKILEPEIIRFFTIMQKNMNLFELTISMEHECISDACIFIAKKRYIMNQIYKEGEWFLDKLKLKIKGIEVVRTSTPQYVRDFLSHALKLIFTADNDTLKKYIEDSKRKFQTLPFKKIAFPRGCNGFDKYNIASKGLPIALRAAMIGNQALISNNLTNNYRKINEGDKIHFSYIKVPNKFHSNVIGFLDTFPEELSNDVKIDYNEQWQKAAVAPIQKILGSFGWKVEDDNSIEDFFS